MSSSQAYTLEPQTKTAAKYKRVLLKLSGEALMGSRQFGQDRDTIQRFATDIAEAYHKGIQLCLVVGGGNIFRGVSGAAEGMDRATADQMGMLATTINALAIQNALDNIGIPSRVQSAITMSSICEPYIRRRAIRHMEKGRIVIFACGIGSPFFTTDTAAALRAVEMHCDVLLKGTQVDGVYSDNPRLNPEAKRYTTLSHMDVLKQELKIMDAAALSLAKENNLPIMVFSLHESGELWRVINHQGQFTLIA